MSEAQQKDEGTTTRKWFYLILENPDEDRVGQVVATDTHGWTTAKKNEPGARHKRNLETDESYVQREVGLGCHTFESEEDYEQNVGDVLGEKLGEIDEEHLINAGLDPEEVLDS